MSAFSIETLPMVTVGMGIATAEGKVISLGGYDAAVLSWEIGKQPDLSDAVPVDNSLDKSVFTDNATYSVDFTGLDYGTTYYYRVTAKPVALNDIDSVKRALESHGFVKSTPAIEGKAFADAVSGDTDILSLMVEDATIMANILESPVWKTALHDSLIAEEAIRSSAVAMTAMNEHAETYYEEGTHTSMNKWIYLHSGKAFLLSFTRGTTWNHMDTNLATYVENYSSEGAGSTSINRMYEPLEVRSSHTTGTANNVVTVKWVQMD